MFSFEKRAKLSHEASVNKNISAAAVSIDQGIESDCNSQVDFTSSGADFSLPMVKRRAPAPRHSYGQLKRQSSESAEQSSLGYSSLVSSSSSSIAPKSRTPKKRKFDESDENAFYNSHNFVSPLKIRKTDRDAKLVLKEKSSSENVILCSTPIKRDDKKTKLWGKFRSLHPERFETGVEPIEKFSHILPRTTEEAASFDIGSSFDLTASFDLTSNHESHIPQHIQSLCTGSIGTGHSDTQTLAKPSPTETVTKPQEPAQESRSPNAPVISPPRRFNCGRLKLDILSTLSRGHDLPLMKILGYMSDQDLLTLSHVSKDYRNMIKSHKTLESRRLAYLKKFQEVRENMPPGAVKEEPNKIRLTPSRKRAFGDVNVNHSMQLRSKPPSPPVSPSRQRFQENQKVTQSHKGLIKKCPRCSKPAVIHKVQIRSSPRKKKKPLGSLMSISSGRVTKRPKTFLSKTSIETHSPADSFLTFLDDSRASPSTSSSCASPSSFSSDDSSGCEGANDAVTYEFGVCSGISCNFKFCVKCNCKYHPRQLCKDFSPASPTRGHINKSSVACSSQSFKSLKRLVY